VNPTAYDLPYDSPFLGLMWAGVALAVVAAGLLWDGVCVLREMAQPSMDDGEKSRGNPAAGTQITIIEQ
jgi:high-affinity Fe2+/Pb2+ permease